MGDAETGGVAEEATERDGLGGDAGRGRSGRKGSGRDFPGLEGGVDVGVEGELAGIDEGEEADGGDGFADGGGLEERVGGDGYRIAGAGDAVSAGPGYFSVGDDGNTDAGNTVNNQALQTKELTVDKRRYRAMSLSYAEWNRQPFLSQEEFVTIEAE